MKLEIVLLELPGARFTVGVLPGGQVPFRIELAKRCPDEHHNDNCDAAGKPTDRTYWVQVDSHTWGVLALLFAEACRTAQKLEALTGAVAMATAEPEQCHLCRDAAAVRE
jgi:hypothetical protein